MSVWSKYEIVRHSVQLVDAMLFSLTCNLNENAAGSTNLSVSVNKKFEHDAENEKIIQIYLNVSLEGPFSMDVTYLGKCNVINDEFDKEQYGEFVNDLIVPFLLPYVRECVASTLSRMQVPIFTLPTIDILQSLIVNHPESGE